MTTTETQAAAYARATCSNRCARMGECDGCQMRNCDYRSRKEAYLDGYASAIRDYGIITEMPTKYTPNIAP